VKTKARIVGFRDRKSARTVGFCKQKIPHKKSFVPLVASCVKTGPDRSFDLADEILKVKRRTDHSAWQTEFSRRKEEAHGVFPSVFVRAGAGQGRAGRPGQEKIKSEK
jgi:hypothetical protein